LLENQSGRYDCTRYLKNQQERVRLPLLVKFCIFLSDRAHTHFKRKVHLLSASDTKCKKTMYTEQKANASLALHRFLKKTLFNVGEIVLRIFRNVPWQEY